MWIDRSKRIPIALTIAGSDSGGGAGIEADLKTFSAVGVHGTVALTTVTSQNSTGVFAVHPIPEEHISSQIEAVAVDMGIDAAKTGMLFSREIIDTVAESVDKFGFPLVVDPVMIAKSGAPLLKDDAVDALIERILPRARVVTPNRFEAERITGIKVRSLLDAENAAKEISQLGVEAVVVKGGHLEGDESVDILYYRGRIWRFRLPRLETDNTHGTGCSFSAAIAGYIARGMDIVKAVEKAKQLVHYSIKYGLPVGKGVGSVNPLAILYLESEKYNVLSTLWEAYKALRNIKGVSRVIPECRTNFVYALPEAEDIDSVAGFPGRITVVDDQLYAVSYPHYGASSHVARIVLTALRFDPTIRSAINLRYDEKLIEKAREKGLLLSMFDRSLEPRHISRVEGRSLSWGVEYAIKAAHRVPDIIYDTGAVGKEPMIRVLGRTPFDIVDKIRLLLEGD
jgi:hydroxymethylpyrimidine/phosphomethylpyrimidine kinase